MRFANRVNSVPKSFVREILKVTERPEVISFAGGLPNPDLFPVEDIANATKKVLSEDGEKVLQYSTTEGYLPLRKFIVERYYKDCNVTAGNILITNGSQQGLDLIAKIFLDQGNHVMLERPGYLGAIQSFSMFEPNFITVGLEDDGINLTEFEEKLSHYAPKLFYAVTNFQNPTGVCYSQEKREQIAEIIKKTDTIMIDDNPYGELRFYGEPCSSMKSLLGDRVIALGSFSKIFSPSMRLGWICASDEIIDKVITMKQASDLHTNYFSQRVLYQYLQDYDINEHIDEISKEYKQRRDYMVEMINQYIPSNVTYTEPDGGMFLWMRLPDEMDASKLLKMAGDENVAFVPGVPFYALKTEDPRNTMRLNYTNSSFEDIETGIKTLASVIMKYDKQFSTIL